MKYYKIINDDKEITFTVDDQGSIVHQESTHETLSWVGKPWDRVLINLESVWKNQHLKEIKLEYKYS